MPSAIVPHPKSIAVVGGGTAGIAALKALLDLPESTRRNWTIDLFEQREDLGGVWYAPFRSPSLAADASRSAKVPRHGTSRTPHAALHPPLSRHANQQPPSTKLVLPRLPRGAANAGPWPPVTFPNDPYPAGTNLFPPHAEVRAHLLRFADKHGLRRFVRFGHEVLDATFDPARRWTLEVVANDTRETLQYEYVRRVFPAFQLFILMCSSGAQPSHYCKRPQPLPTPPAL